MKRIFSVRQILSYVFTTIRQVVVIGEDREWAHGNS